MKTKSLYIFVIMLLIFTSTYAQNNKKDAKDSSKYKHSVGAAAGFSTGYGLSYRVYKDKIGAQLTFSPYKTDNVTRHSLGVTFLFKLDQRKNTDLFIYQGNHYFYRRNHYTYDSYYYNQDNSVKSDFIHGLGLGMNFNVLSPISVSFMAGYAAYDSFNKFNLTVEAAIFYKL